LIRVVLDTNVLVSALLFDKGRLAWIRHGWQAGRFTPVLAPSTTRELLRVLTYPKFKLNAAEIQLLLAELLPWSETWQDPLELSDPLCCDPRDQVFLDLAIAAKVHALVSGDADLLALRDQPRQPLLLDPAGFQSWLLLQLPLHR
jgi:hypothetical protein